MEPFPYLKKEIHRHEFHVIAKTWSDRYPVLVSSLNSIYGALGLPVPVICSCLMGQGYDRCMTLLLRFRSAKGPDATWETLIRALGDLELNDEAYKLGEMARSSTGPSLWSLWSNVARDSFRCKEIAAMCIVFVVYAAFTGFLGWGVFMLCHPTPPPAVSSWDLTPSPRACSGLGDYDIRFDLHNRPTQQFVGPSTSSNIQFVFSEFGLSITAFMFSGRMVSAKHYNFRPGRFYTPTTLPRLRTLAFTTLNEVDSLQLFEIFMTMELPELRTIALTSVSMNGEDHMDPIRAIIRNSKTTLQLLVLTNGEHQDDWIVCSILTDEICDEMRPGFRIVGNCKNLLARK